MATTILAQDVIERLLADPLFTGEFQFLKEPPRETRQLTNLQKRKCRGCRRKMRNMLKKLVPGPVDFSAVKRQLLELPPERIVRFKELLGADEVTVHYRDSAGQLQTKQI